MHHLVSKATVIWYEHCFLCERSARLRDCHSQKELMFHSIGSHFMKYHINSLTHGNRIVCYDCISKETEFADRRVLIRNLIGNNKKYNGHFGTITHRPRGKAEFGWLGVKFDDPVFGKRNIDRINISFDLTVKPDEVRQFESHVHWSVWYCCACTVLVLQCVDVRDYRIGSGQWGLSAVSYRLTDWNDVKFNENPTKIDANRHKRSEMLSWPPVRSDVDFLTYTSGYQSQQPCICREQMYSTVCLMQKYLSERHEHARLSSLKKTLCVYVCVCVCVRVCVCACVCARACVCVCLS